MAEKAFKTTEINSILIKSKQLLAGVLHIFATTLCALLTLACIYETAHNLMAISFERLHNLSMPGSCAGDSPVAFGMPPCRRGRFAIVRSCFVRYAIARIATGHLNRVLRVYTD